MSTKSPLFQEGETGDCCGWESFSDNIYVAGSISLCLSLPSYRILKMYLHSIGLL